VDGADLDHEVVLGWEAGTRPLPFRHLRLATRAQEAAAGGHAAMSDRAIEAAWEELCQVDGHGVGYFAPQGPDGDRLAGHRGTAAVQLGRHDQAAVILEGALDSVPADIPKVRADILVSLAPPTPRSGRPRSSTSANSWSKG
jgi:hypothetical protein